MKGKIVHISRIADGIVDMRAEIALRDPAPGRFVHISAPGVFLRRPISLCGYENGMARLVFAVKGQGTAALAELCKGGGADMLGALGNGLPKPSTVNSQLSTVLIGGGIGLPPLLYYAQTYPNTHTIAGFRSKDQVILADEFPSLELCFGEDYPHVRLEKLLQKGENIGQVLACGPFPLLKAVAGVCARHGTPCSVSMEERMACGVGACLVCACAIGGRYLRCCKDGPVFDASEVSWEGVL
jgi:dihydroorotate dehydrogenase electron transfer subunit